MLQPGRELDLALEPLGAQDRRQLGMQHLQGDRPVVLQVVGQVDRGHAPAPELSLERIENDDRASARDSLEGGIEINVRRLTWQCDSGRLVPGIQLTGSGG